MGKAPAKDALFLDPDQAMKTAQCANRVQITPAVTGLQVCYYLSDVPIQDGPPNLVHVPIRDGVKFFSTTALRLPREIVFPAGMDQSTRQQVAAELHAMLEEACLLRDKTGERFHERAQRRQPVFDETKPLRIWLPTTRETTVLQYAAVGLADAFRQLGQDARLFIEQSDMEHHDYMHVLRDFCEFSPHVTINLNHLNNDWLHPDVTNVVWWQDDMPEIMAGAPLPWRDNDFAYTATSRLVRIVEKTGISGVQFQPIPVDGNVFRRYPDVQREEKFVFAGSSYLRAVGKSEGAIMAVARFCDMAAHGEPIDHEVLNDVCERFGIPETLGSFALNYAVRDKVIEWVCEQSEIPVEIYGRGWEDNPIVAPFFKGEVKHGEELARIYCSAKYSISGIQLENLTQRLAEIGACGCIPILYDFRNCTSPPYWEDEVLYFRTKAQLYKCLNTTIPTHPDRFRDYYNYVTFAKKILNDIGLGNYVRNSP